MMRFGKAIATSFLVGSFVLIFAALAQAGPVAIDVVWVHDVGNTADTTTYGAVAYVYAIGKYEVTATQYTAFLNAVASSDPNGLYNAAMAGSTGCGITRNGTSGSYTYTLNATYANRPVNFVNQYDGFRMANWIQNGEPNGLGEVAGSTEAGTYTMSGPSSTSFAPDATYRLNNYNSPATAHWVVPTDNEWYKAAYYKGGGTSAGYWSYATQSNSLPGTTYPDLTGNNANFNNAGGSPTDVGRYALSVSAYGTFDQTGNVAEYVQSGFVRGGEYDYSGISPFLIDKTSRYAPGGVGGENAFQGIRLGLVPEPGTMAMLIGLALMGMVYWRRPKA